MEEVDEFWSNLLEELQSKSIPTYSLVSQFGFPLALRGDELVIGVMKEHFQKTLENKADHIKTAAKRLLGKELFIKVKVQTPDPGRAPQSHSTQSHSQPAERAVQSQREVASSQSAPQRRR